MKNIYASGEEYLKWILKIQNKIGKVRSIDLAEYMGFSRPSICKAVKRLEENEYIIKDKEGYLCFTEKGQAIAEQFYERHQFLTEFLLDIGVEKEIAVADACKMEHAISEETFTKLKEKFGYLLNREA